MRTLFTCSLEWELRREHVPYGTPSLAYINLAPDQQSLYPDGQHTHAFYIKCAPPVGLDVVVRFITQRQLIHLSRTIKKYWI